MIARIEIDEALAHDVHKYNLHPSILDGCFQSLMAMLDSQDTTYLPTHIGELNFYAVSTEKLEQIWCVGRMIEKTDRTLKCDLHLLDNEGNVVVTIRGLKATAAQPSLIVALTNSATRSSGKSCDITGTMAKRLPNPSDWATGSPSATLVKLPNL